MSDRAEVAADTSQASASAPDLASEILENLELNRKAHGLANANSTAVTLIGAALKFILDARGPAAARRELADIGEVLEAAIKFAHIERGLSSDLETARRELADIGEVLEAAIKFAHIERGLSSDLETARRELADIGEVLEAAIKFAHIERGLSSDLETARRELADIGEVLEAAIKFAHIERGLSE